ncbi:MAG: hypothetical protein ABR606_17660 [Vicinamibacterales bacterium]
MPPSDPNQDTKRPIEDRAGQHEFEESGRAPSQPEDRSSRADDAGLDVDDQDQGGDQDIDTAGIPGVDPEVKKGPDAL